jgi:hypothetical protein
VRVSRRVWIPQSRVGRVRVPVHPTTDQATVRVCGADFTSAMPSDCKSADVGSTPTLVSILPSNPAAPEAGRSPAVGAGGQSEASQDYRPRRGIPYI